MSAVTNSGVDLSGADTTATAVANAIGGVSLSSPPIGTTIYFSLKDAGINISFADADDIANALGSAVADYTPPDTLTDVGTVYSVTNLGGGFENVYVATPDADGTAAGHITDTLVTPFGNLNIPTSYDATAPMGPGAAFTGLGVTSDATGLSDNAFTIDGTTFDPGADGLTGIGPTTGIAPLLQIGGGSLAGIPLGSADLDVYDSSGADLGSVDTTVTTSNLLGFIDTTQLSVTNFGSGWENVYEAIPNPDGTAASSITDTLITPFGNVDLSSVFDAIAPLDPGDAAAGVSDAGGAAGSASADSFNLFDPSTWF